jgi:hypothetical protein
LRLLLAAAWCVRLVQVLLLLRLQVLRALCCGRPVVEAHGAGAATRAWGCCCCDAAAARVLALHPCCCICWDTACRSPCHQLLCRLPMAAAGSTSRV